MNDAELWTMREATGRGPQVVEAAKALHEAGRLVGTCDRILERARRDDFVPDRLMVALANSLILGADDEGAPALRPRRAALTPALVQVARLVPLGFTDSEIAERLHVGRETVKSHMTDLRRQSGAKNRVQVALWVLANPEGIFH